MLAFLVGLAGANVAFWWFVYGLWPISWGAYVVFLTLGFLLGLIQGLLKSRD
jgi:hypothetical protein